MIRDIAMSVFNQIGENMTIPKNERQAIKTKKCFPNKRVDDLLWRRAKSIDNCLDEDKILEQEDDFKWNRAEIYEMFLTAFEEGYKKGFASGESYCSEKELYQEVADEFEQMTKNDTYEELYGTQKGEK